MKIDIKQENALIVGGQATTMGLNKLDPSVFVQMLIRLYQFPVEATVRETLSNSWDSVIDAGSITPPVVGLTKDKFFVQDFGTGMSPEFMLSSTEGFSTIGYSTKRDKNNQLGYWGFGKVVALSYTRDQFWLHTVWEGKAYEYLVFLDGNTIKVILLKEEPTSEPNGTRIVVQLKKDWNEINKWYNAIKEQCAYFEGTHIELDGQNYIVEIEKDGFIWKSNLCTKDTHLVLGSVYYDIPWEKFSSWDYLRHLKIGIHFDLDEGITPVPSREAWEFNETSKALLESKFKIIAEKLYQSSETFLKEVSTKSEIEQLEIINAGMLPDCTLKTYKDVCASLNKVPFEFLFKIDEVEFSFTDNTIYKQIQKCFDYPISDRTKYYCDYWTPLRVQYINSIGGSVAKKNKNKLDLYYWIDCNLQFEDKEIFVRRVEQILLNQFVDKNFIRIDEVDFVEWKKERKAESKTIKTKGLITYYRGHVYDKYQCVKDTKDINLSDYRYIFKAKEETAKRYWNTIRKMFNNFIITKDYGMDLDNLEVSPLLKRMCSQSLKIRVSNTIENCIDNTNFKNLIKEINPLLHQYISEIKFPQESFTTEHEALIEVGELLRCFDKDEMKLRYIEHHLKHLVIYKYITGASEYYNHTLSKEESDIIKRYYLLERLAEHKWKEPEKEEVNINQLELELN